MNGFDIRGEVNIQRVGLDFEYSDGTRTAPFEVLALRMNGMPVPEEACKTIPQEPVNGPVLGRVNLHWGCEGLPHDGHLHVLWLNQNGEIRTSIIPRVPPAGEDPLEWERRFNQLASSDHIFVAV